MDDNARCGEAPARCRLGGHGAPRLRGRIRSRSADTGNVGRSRAKASSDTHGWAGKGARSALALRPIVRLGSPGAPRRPGDLGKGSGQVAQQTIERACQDHRTRNDDIVVARLACAGEHLPGRLRKPAARPVARDGIANSSAGGEAQADLGAAVRRRSEPDLENEGRRYPTAPASRDGEELATPLETRYRGCRLAPITQADAAMATARLAGQPLATPGAPAREHPTAANGCHAGAKTMAPLANDVARLIGALHARPLANPRPNRSAV
jgi:hypothetical protein